MLGAFWLTGSALAREVVLPHWKARLPHSLRSGVAAYRGVSARGNAGGLADGQVEVSTSRRVEAQAVVAAEWPEGVGADHVDLAVVEVLSSAEAAASEGLAAKRDRGGVLPRGTQGFHKGALANRA